MDLPVSFQRRLETKRHQEKEKNNVDDSKLDDMLLVAKKYLEAPPSESESSLQGERKAEPEGYSLPLSAVVKNQGPSSFRPKDQHGLNESCSEFSDTGMSAASSSHRSISSSARHGRHRLRRRRSDRHQPGEGGGASSSGNNQGSTAFETMVKIFSYNVNNDSDDDEDAQILELTEKNALSTKTTATAAPVDRLLVGNSPKLHHSTHQMAVTNLSPQQQRQLQLEATTEMAKDRMRRERSVRATRTIDNVDRHRPMAKPSSMPPMQIAIEKEPSAILPPPPPMASSPMQRSIFDENLHGDISDLETDVDDDQEQQRDQGLIKADSTVPVKVLLTPGHCDSTKPEEKLSSKSQRSRSGIKGAQSPSTGRSKSSPLQQHPSPGEESSPEGIEASSRRKPSRSNATPSGPNKTHRPGAPPPVPPRASSGNKLARMRNGTDTLRTSSHHSSQQGSLGATSDHEPKLRGSSHHSRGTNRSRSENSQLSAISAVQEEVAELQSSVIIEGDFLTWEQITAKAEEALLRSSQHSIQSKSSHSSSHSRQSLKLKNGSQHSRLGLKEIHGSQHSRQSLKEINGSQHSRQSLKEINGSQHSRQSLKETNASQHSRQSLMETNVSQHSRQSKVGSRHSRSLMDNDGSVHSRRLSTDLSTSQHSRQSKSGQEGLKVANDFSAQDRSRPSQPVRKSGGSNARQQASAITRIIASVDHGCREPSGHQRQKRAETAGPKPEDGRRNSNEERQKRVSGSSSGSIDDDPTSKDSEVRRNQAGQKRGSGGSTGQVEVASNDSPHQQRGRASGSPNNQKDQIKGKGKPVRGQEGCVDAVNPRRDRSRSVRRGPADTRQHPETKQGQKRPARKENPKKETAISEDPSRRKNKDRLMRHVSRSHSPVPAERRRNLSPGAKRRQRSVSPTGLSGERGRARIRASASKPSTVRPPSRSPSRFEESPSRQKKKKSPKPSETGSPKSLRQLRRPSFGKAEGDVERSPRSLTELSESLISGDNSKGSRPFETDSDEEDTNGSKTVLQFDPSQQDNVFRVRQTVTKNNTLEIDNFDGTKTIGVIAAFVDHVGEAQQFHNPAVNPIFDFLEADEVAPTAKPIPGSHLEAASAAEGDQPPTGGSMGVRAPSGRFEVEDDDESSPQEEEHPPDSLVQFDPGNEFPPATTKSAKKVGSKHSTNRRNAPPRTRSSGEASLDLNDIWDDSHERGADDEEVEEHDVRGGPQSRYFAAMQPGRDDLPDKSRSVPASPLPNTVDFPGVGSQNATMLRELAKRSNRPARPYDPNNVVDLSATDVEPNPDAIDRTKKKKVIRVKIKKKDASTTAAASNPGGTAKGDVEAAPSPPTTKARNNKNNSLFEQALEKQSSNAWESEVEKSPAANKSRIPIGIATSIGRYFNRSRNNMGGAESDQDGGASVSGASVGTRLFRGGKKHQLLGDDSSYESGD